jgi:hypothetical protein
MQTVGEWRIQGSEWFKTTTSVVNSHHCMAFVAGFCRFSRFKFLRTKGIEASRELALSLPAG